MRSGHSTEGEAWPGYEELLAELRMLVDEVTRRAEEYLQGYGQTEDRPAAGTCGWCPLCTFVSIVLRQRPELTARIAEQCAGIFAVLRQLLAEQSSEAPSSDPQPPSETKVQRIAVCRVGGSVLRDDPTDDQTEGQC